ncbi:MAG: AAA family ATPase [Chitinispirillaceae bacterium]|nr:AAA family ATPase [Chitinispirillaceae bacterium]
MSYLDHWKLREKPFEELCDTRFFFESEDHREALDRMLYVVNDRNMNMGLLTGEVGSGKTITKNVLTGSLPAHQFTTIDFENSNFSFVDLLYDMVRRIDGRQGRSRSPEGGELPKRGDKYLLMQTFKQQVETLLYEEKKHLVVIFDEAQQIDDPVIDEIKNLTNLTAGTENFLTIFFVGQPELREKVKRLRQVDQRIFLRFHLNNLDYNGTNKYIQHRLRVAGHDMNALFTSLAFELVFRSSGGVPREINRLCKLALNYGFAQNLPELSREDIQVILEDIERQG